MQALLMTMKIRGRDRQVEWVSGGQERFAARCAGHRVQRIGQQAGKTDPGEWRLEPPTAHEAAQLASHVLTHFGGHAFGDPASGSRQNHFDERGCPEFRRRSPAAGSRIQQPVDVRIFQPQIGKRFERLPGVNCLREENSIDPACACAGNDVGKKPQLWPARVVNIGQQVVVDMFAIATVRCAGMKSTAGARELPQLLGDAMHIYGKADPAVAHKSDAKLLLTHAPAWPEGAAKAIAAMAAVTRQQRHRPDRLTSFRRRSRMGWAASDLLPAG